MNILFSESKTLSQVKQFTGYTSNEKEFIVYAEWDIDDGWFVHGVMFTEPDTMKLKRKLMKSLNSFTNIFNQIKKINYALF